jgi:hypothetical protein
MPLAEVEEQRRTSGFMIVSCPAVNCKFKVVYKLSITSCPLLYTNRELSSQAKVSFARPKLPNVGL